MTALWERRRTLPTPGVDVLRPLAGVVMGVAATGPLLAGLWFLLAPHEVARVTDEGLEPLPGENEHNFDGLAILVLLALGAGVVIAVALWMFRELRGPVTLLVSCGAAMLATAIAVWVGEALVELRYDESGAVGSLVDVAPEIETWWVLLVMPLGVALTYATLTACTTTPNLGRRSDA